MMIIDIPITFPHDFFSLSSYKSKGKLPDDVELPEEPEAPQTHHFDASALSQLEAMGFPTIRCQRALLATGNSGADAAMEWLFSHLDDPGKSINL
jgi:ubiquitin carboxyl-terminal hydrolase 5/13